MAEELRSVLEEAASLPPDAPRILRIDQHAPQFGEVACEIEIEEFEDESRSQRWRDFSVEAKAYHEQLLADDRTPSIPHLSK
jgi:hypothetical protein